MGRSEKLRGRLRDQACLQVVEQERCLMTVCLHPVETQMALLVATDAQRTFTGRSEAF